MRVITRAAAVAGVFLLLLPSRAAAQAPTSPSMGLFLYGVSAGIGRRMTSGTFLPTEEPLGAGEPPSPRSTASIDLVGGLNLGPRVALVAMYEGGATLGDSHNWGTFAAHAAIRAWLARRVWVEGGGGVAELAFRASSTPNTATTRWWQPGVEAAAGYDIFEGPTVAIQALVRYSEASFDAVRLQSVSVQVGLLGR